MLNIAEWNINQQGGRGGSIPSWLLEEVDESVDVIVLTEFRRDAKGVDYLYSSLESKGYSYVESFNQRGNDILVAVRNDIRVVGFHFYSAYIEGSELNCIPENLRVDIEYNGKTISIFGVRIKELEGDYTARRNQMVVLSEWLESCGNSVVVVGDFNNLRGNTNIKDWNLTVLDNILKRIRGKKVFRSTPLDLHSWGVAYREHKDLFDGYIRNDHLLISDDLVCIDGSIKYSWDFVSRYRICYSISDYMNYFGDRKITVEKGCPDHAILYASIEVV